MVKKRRKLYVLILIFLTVYVCFSAFLGFPLGFGKITERNAAKNYCSIVYPQAQLGKTVFNPVANGYQTVVYLDGEPNYIGVNLTEQTISDPYRAASFLKGSGVGALESELKRTHDCFIACQVVWPCNDLATPVMSLRLDYTDYESSPLPDEGQIKELLAPVVLDCIIQVEELYPLNKAIIKYYHPDFKPDEHGMTWRTMEISLNHDIPRTKELLDTAELTAG
ncbi:MAG: hypothetical protein ACI3W5_04615 [Faecousia sp.]